MVKLTMLLVVLILFTSCTSIPQEKNLRELVIKNAEKVSISFLQLDQYIDFKKLTPVDSAFLPALAKYDFVQNRGCAECAVHFYYHSYFNLQNNLVAAVFAKSNELMSGAADQLIIALIDEEGNMVEAFLAAEMSTFAECNYFVTTTLNNKNMVITDKEDCTITSGVNAGLSNTDSSTYYYTVTNGGLMVLDSSTSYKVER